LDKKPGGQVIEVNTKSRVTKRLMGRQMDTRPLANFFALR
jgi:hypothetical protein